MLEKDIGPVRILAVAPYETMAVSLKKSAERFPDVLLDAFTGDLQEGVEILQSRDMSVYDAILSRGGTADMIRRITDLPVIEIPVMIYDILRTIKLAENYTDRMAVVGFPGVTENAHTLCSLLRLKMPIETVHSSEEIPGVLDRLRRQQINTVICDVVSHRTARDAGFQALLITSGERSLSQAIGIAIQQGRLFRRMKSENTLLRSMLQQNMQQCVVFNAEKDVVYSFMGKLSDGTAAAMRRRISAIPENRELLFYYQEGAALHSIIASRFQLRGQQLYLFRDEPARISLRSAQPGIRFYDAVECEQLLSGSFFTLSGSMGTLESRLTAFSNTLHPLMIIGEEGTGREQVARTLYLQSELRNHPLVVVDGARLNDRSWNYLMEHHASPLGTTRTAVFFHHLEELSSQRQQALLSLIEETGLARRLWLLFACEIRDGRIVDVFAEKLSSRLAPLTVELPSLRSRRDEIPALASIYLSNLDMELGKQVSGFEPGVLEMLTRYDWPGNYAQFKHVLHELCVVTDGHYISGTDAAEIMAREHGMFRRLPEVPGGFSSAGMTLEEIERNVIEHTLNENKGNQSRTARQLGISRSTLWRVLSGGGKE
jgi:transcriptional regulator of acetoin/glycerol metabolism